MKTAKNIFIKLSLVLGGYSESVVKNMIYAQMQREYKRAEELSRSLEAEEKRKAEEKLIEDTLRSNTHL